MGESVEMVIERGVASGIVVMALVWGGSSFRKTEKKFADII